jgi:hypothetical protein
MIEPKLTVYVLFVINSSPRTVAEQGDQIHGVYLDHGAAVEEVDRLCRDYPGRYNRNLDFFIVKREVQAKAGAA